MSTRRSFLGFLGLSPLAAKAAADKTIADLSGISEFPVGRAPAPSYVSGETYPGNTKASSVQDRVMRFLREKALPDWFEEDLRARYRQVDYLDPDIANKKSWSMAVKIMTQRERNIQRAKDQVFYGPKRMLRQQEFEKEFGVWL